MSLEQLKKNLLELFSDTSVPAETTRDRLVDLRDEIDTMISALNEDIDD